jgi:hypothetical protein
MAIVAGALTAFFFGRILDPLLGPQAGTIVGSVLWIPLAFVSLRWALLKQYGSFRLVAVSPT